MPNIIQYENVTFTVGGANPQTKTVQATFSVNPTTGIGTATVSFPYTGTNSGVDTITASLPSFGYTSNAATVAWQATNGLIAVGNQITVGSLQAAGQSNGWTITSPQPFTSTIISPGSLYWNHWDHQDSPGEFAGITAQGTFVGTQHTGFGTGDTQTQFGANDTFQMVWTGWFVVSQAGNITFNWQVDDNVLFGIGPALSGGGSVTTVSSSPFPNGKYSASVTPFQGYPLLMISDRSENGSAPAASYYGTFNFSQPGVYPFEIDFANTGGAPSQCQLTYNGGNTGGPYSAIALYGSIIAPVPLISAPAQPAAGTQNLVLTPTGGASNLLLQGQTATLTLNITATFTTQPYIPLLEGSAGQVYVYNDPLNPTFTFPTFYTDTPDGPSAALNDFVLTGDNTAWQGQVAFQWNTTLSKFQLYYNGSQALAANQLFAPNVQLTNLTLAQEDIAWFNSGQPAGSEYDLFQATAAGGGKFATIPVYYQINPNYPAGAAVQVSPTTVVTGAPAPPAPITAIRRASWSSSTNIGVNTAGTIITVWGGTYPGTLPASLVVGGQVTLAGFASTFPTNSNSGAGSTGPVIAYNLNGVWTVQSITSAVIGGSESLPAFTLTAPFSAYSRSLDFGSPDGKVVNSGWTFQPVVPPGSTSTTFTVTLARPLPPIQNNTVMSVAFSGTQPSNVSVTPNMATINSIPGWIVSYSVNATFPAQAVSTTTTMTFTFTTPTITFLGLLGTAVDAFTTKTNYTYPGPAPTATITLQSTATTAPYNVSLVETNGGTPLLTAGIGATTVLTATWVSYNNNFSNTVFYITPNGGSKTALGTVLASSATITSIGGGKYQAVFQLSVPTSTYYNTSTYQFSYTGTCTDSTTVSYLDTNYYDSNNTAPAGGGGGTTGGGACFSGHVEFMTPSGAVRFDECPSVIIIQNETGIHTADLIIHEEALRDMIDMGGDKLVTPDHLMKLRPEFWCAADDFFSSKLYPRVEYFGKVFNLHVRSDDPRDQHFVLSSGEVAHNIKVA